ncbi:hypothetical protein OG897_40650 [Streptomyces sp. NBC_00237]|uniref:hypothetical protein n=1 Tax=Streptomyces sp. NBC_00237 TaxID=2975687 RepID=UPI00225B3404|nr:hypothetical protein [Streptomyces sp. NBC_00237]MCX5207695.1 hypothetical protein [Streptomyces sp. NBC_00237]
MFYEIAAAPTGVALRDAVLILVGNLLMALCGYRAFRLFMAEKFDKMPTFIAGAIFCAFFTYFPEQAKAAISGIAQLVPSA